MWHVPATRGFLTNVYTDTNVRIRKTGVSRSFPCAYASHTVLHSKHTPQQQQLLNPTAVAALLCDKRTQTHTAALLFYFYAEDMKRTCGPSADKQRLDAQHYHLLLLQHDFSSDAA